MIAAEQAYLVARNPRLGDNRRHLSPSRRHIRLPSARTTTLRKHKSEGGLVSSQLPFRKLGKDMPLADKMREGFSKVL
jgi:hypothetical protein